MRRILDLFSNELSKNASKAATDALWQEDNGVSAYSLAGKIFIGCGVGWLLITLIPIACGNSLSDCLWMLILAAIQIILGIILIVLCKKSERFRKLVIKDFKKDLNRKEKLEEKAKIGKVTLPLTNGDVLALKICAVIFVIIFLIIKLFG